MSALHYNYSSLQEDTPRAGRFMSAPSLLQLDLKKKALLDRLESTYRMGINESDAELESIENDASLIPVLLDIVHDRHADTELRAISARLYTSQMLRQVPDMSELEDTLRECLVADKALVRQGVLYALEDHEYLDLIRRLFADETDDRLRKELKEILQD